MTTAFILTIAILQALMLLRGLLILSAGMPFRMEVVKRSQGAFGVFLNTALLCWSIFVLARQ